MTREEKVRNLLAELIDMIDNGSQRNLDRADEIGASIIKLFEQEPTKNDLGVDCISREDVLMCLTGEFENREYELSELIKIFSKRIKALPSVTPQPKTGHCNDCKWWKDSDGEYRRGCGAESKCPINTKTVYLGKGYCYKFEPQESEGWDADSN